MRGGSAYIGQYAEPARAIREHVLKRLARVMGDRIWEDAQVANRHSFITPQHLQVDIGFVGTYCLGGAPTHVQRNRPFARQRQRAAYVIAMLMRDQNRIESLDARADARQT